MTAPVLDKAIHALTMIQRKNQIIVLELRLVPGLRRSGKHCRVGTPQIAVMAMLGGGEFGENSACPDRLWVACPCRNAVRCNSICDKRLLDGQGYDPPS